MPKVAQPHPVESAPLSNEEEFVRETRFDPPHELVRDDAGIEFPSDALLAAGVRRNAVEPEATAAAESVEAIYDSLAADTALGKLSTASADQFRMHAEQLVAHLDQRQRDLDRREAELHARLAQHESNARNSRLWFQERHHDLLKRQAELEEHDRQLSDRLAEFDKRLEAENSATHASLNIQQEQAHALAIRQDELAIRELDLQQRQAAVEELASRAAQRGEMSNQQELLLKQREESLAASEALLARGQVEMADERNRLAEERADFKCRYEEQQQKLIEKQRRMEIDTEKQKEVLNVRYQQLEQRGVALDQLRSELVRLQQEALEMRLATEELWSELSGLVQPAAITQSLARLRTKLAENYRLQTADALEQRKETEALAMSVTHQHEKLSHQRREFESWINSQRREIDQQATQLAAREHELDTQRQQIEHQRLQWDSERHRLENESRRLQGELRRRIVNAPAFA